MQAASARVLVPELAEMGADARRVCVVALYTTVVVWVKLESA